MISASERLLARFRDILRTHPALCACAAFAFAFVGCLSFPAETPLGVQAGAALGTGVALALLVALLRERNAIQKRASQRSFTVLALVSLALSACAVCALSFAALDGLPAVALDLRTVGAFLALAAGTGLCEEALFRCVIFEAIAASWQRRNVLSAAFAAAALFALLHLTAMPADPTPIAIAQVFAKFAQAFCFSLVLTALWRHGVGLAALAAVHALYDAASFAVPFALTGALPATYASGSPLDLAATVTATALLLPAVIRAVRLLRQDDRGTLLFG